MDGKKFDDLLKILKEISENQKEISENQKRCHDLKIRTMRLQCITCDRYHGKEGKTICLCCKSKREKEQKDRDDRAMKSFNGDINDPILKYYSINRGGYGYDHVWKNADLE